MTLMEIMRRLAWQRARENFHRHAVAAQRAMDLMDVEWQRYSER